MIEYVLLVVGIALLIKGADLLVEGSSSLAKRMGMPTLLVGLTVVAFGTSMPELVVSVLSALSGATDVALGNAIGSNISNILLVLGITAIIHPIRVQHSTVWREIPFALLAAVALFVVSADFLIDRKEIFSLTKVDGIVMLLFFAIFIYYVVESARAKKTGLEDKKLIIKERKISFSILMVLAGLVGLILGGKWVVDGAVFIARSFGLSEFLISSTIVAIGTSLPELVTSIVAALKGDVDLAVGNIVGSNIFNIFWILGVTALIAPIAVPLSVTADLVILMAVTAMLFLVMFVGKRHRISRWEGIAFTALYACYVAFLVLRG